MKTLSDLPTDLLLKIGGYAGDKTNTELAETCKRLHFVFAPGLDARAQRDAKELVGYVLNPTPENIVKAKAMYEANPRLLFIETEGLEPASGVDENGQVVYRKFIGSALKAVLGTGDSERYNDMDTHFDKVVYRDEKGNVVETGRQRAQRQMQEKFPHGFAYPPIDDEFSAHIAKIVTAITEDQGLITNNNPSPATQALLADFRKKFLPKDATQGHHFNLNYLIEVCNVYERQLWNLNQFSLFFRQVIGYLEGQVTVVQAQAICEGILNHLDRIEQKRPHSRSLDVYHYPSNSNISYFGPAPDGGVLGFNFGIEIWARGPAPDGVLGFNFGIELLAWVGAVAGVGGRGRTRAATWRALQSYVEQTHQNLTTFSNTLSRTPAQLTQQPVSSSKCTIL